MRFWARYHHRYLAAARAFGLLSLVCALLAPKVSLAIAATVGEGYTTVIVCTGGALVRVSVSPQGDVVEDISEAWASAHCVLQDEPTRRLERAWRMITFPEFTVVAYRDNPLVADSIFLSRQTICNRGPPAQY